MSGRYVRLADNVKIHRTPTDGYLKFDRMHLGKPRQDIWLINQAAVRVLEHCDGTRAIAEIANLVFGDHSEEINGGPIHDFFAEAERKGHVVLSDQPAAIAGGFLVGREDCYVPLHISVELTARCNLKCTYCYNDFDEHESGEPELTTPELLGVLEEWNGLGLSGIELTGGEPLIYPGFWQVMEYCHEQMSVIALLTNGVALTEESADRLVKYADKLVASVSLDGSGPAHHDRTRGPGTYELAAAAIRRLSDRGVKVRAAFSLTPDNWTDLEAAIANARALGATYFAYSPIAPFGRAERDGWRWGDIPAEEIAAVEARAMVEHAGFLASVTDEARNAIERAGNCGAGYKNVTLSPTGKVRACSFMRESSFLGDVRRESLLEIFRKPVFTYLHDLRYPDETTCQGCRYFTYCGNCWMRPLSVMKREGAICRWAAETGIVDQLRFPELAHLEPRGEVFPWGH